MGFCKIALLSGRYAGRQRAECSDTYCSKTKGVAGRTGGGGGAARQVFAVGRQSHSVWTHAAAHGRIIAGRGNQANAQESQILGRPLSSQRTMPELALGSAYRQLHAPCWLWPTREVWVSDASKNRNASEISTEFELC